MKNPTIMIGLLGKPKEEKEDKGLLESGLPEAMMDESVNAQNKAMAVEKAMYGPADKNGRQFCKNCEYFDMEMPELKQGEGFCEIWEFKCREGNVCAAWEFDKPEEEEESEEYEGED